VRRVLLTHGVTPPRAKYRETIARAIADIKGQRDKPASAAPEGLAAG
jgi:SulP family sulfate permease